MRARLAAALVTVVLVGSLAGFYLYNRFIPSPGAGSTPSSSCSDPASISSHIYNSYRLQIVKSCITASGTVDRVLYKADGNGPLRTKLDPAYSNLTNSCNQRPTQNGALVVERISVHRPR